jgi:DNA-binding transcriptional LysR family regulator
MQYGLIETYLCLMETQNFRLAAEQLGITQSTVSARIKALEDTLGSALFLRGRSGAKATAAGLRFEPHARSIKASWGLARQELGTVDRFDGALRIAAQVSFMQSLLADWAGRIRESMPRIALHAEADYSPQMISDISFGNLDIGVMYAPRFLPEIQFEQIFEQRLVLVATRASRLADVNRETYVRADYTPAFERAHAELLPGFSRTSFSVGVETLMVEHLRRHGGAGYVSSFSATKLIEDGAHAIVADAPEITLPVFAAVHFRRKGNRHVRQAFRLLAELAPRYGV